LALHFCDGLVLDLHFLVLVLILDIKVEHFGEQAKELVIELF
jgi:hypothetical protein